MRSSATPPFPTAARSSDRLLRVAASIFAALTLASACSGIDSTGDADPVPAAGTENGESARAISSSSPATSSTTDTSVAETTASTTTTTDPPPTTVAPDARPLPTTETELATAISEAELSLRDEQLPAEDAPSWGRRLQLLYRTLADNEGWATTVLASVDPAIAVDVDANWSARRHLNALVSSTALATNMPAWRIDEPLPSDELLSAYRAAESATGVPWELLASINFIETRMGRIEGLSTAGAVGPMQFLPSTWEGCCEGDPTIDADAIMGAAVYLTLVGAPDDIDGALFSYNRSTDYVEAVKDYASVMERNELAYRGYHAYEVFFRSAEGLVVLRPGYEEPEPVDAATWIAAHPDSLISD